MKGDNIVLERRFVPEGSLIMRKGDAGNCAYLIQSGKVSVFSEHKGKKVELATLELGEIFGELALIFDEPRTASVMAVEDCNLIVLTREVLQKKIERSDPTIKSIVGMLTKRIVSANNSMINQNKDVSDLAETARIIYQNVFGSLKKGQQDAFQAEVLPKLEAFLESVKKFGA